MRLALALAARGQGETWPNPTVGCVLVREGVVVGRGWTQRSGRPHAETEALRRAGSAADGATAYVSLEPCAHHGETAPCAEALIDAGIRRVVVACQDPDPRVNGGGIALLEAAGIEVEMNVLADEARWLNRGFFSRVHRSRPYVTLKLATSLDGAVATAGGESKWLTGKLARRRGHLLRFHNDAVLTGSGTVLADDPRLDCRIPGLDGRPSVRVILDRRARVPLAAAIFAAPGSTLLYGSDDAAPDRKAAVAERGGELIAVPAGAGGGLDLEAVCRDLAGRGMTRLLVEAGGTLSAAFLTAGLVDEIAWFRAPLILGGRARPAFAGFGPDALGDAPGFERVAVETLGDDLLESYRRRL